MAFKVRRVVVANDSSGKAMATSDEVLPAMSVGTETKISGCELWSTDKMPVDNSAEAAVEQKAGVVQRYHDFNYVGNGQGAAFRITEFPPGHAKIPHRTETLDYDVVLAGEIDLELEGSETVHLKTGDSVIVRGATHAWINRGSVPAVLVFIMTDASPVVVNGKELDTRYPV
ncbi:MAG: cupin domain-containing protein [Nostoc sp.]|uniref:cupin domain-containing protein n=1 Tax=Nostoc sp. TaxID=1180 RepID=UPI002FFB9D20